MSININFKSLIIIILLSGCTTSNTSIDNIVDRNDLAPEATTAQADISFWNFPYLEEAFIDLTPTDRKDGLAVGELVVNDDNKALILQLAQELADDKQGKYDSLLISHQDKLVFESYYLRGRVNLPHMQSSVTKSHLSLLVGRAIQLGYLTMADLNKPLVSFLKDLDPTKFVEGTEKVTLNNAMTMRSGLRFSDEQIKEFGTNTDKFKGIDQIQAFLELSAPISSESQTYKYQSPDPIMVMQVLDAVVPGSAKNFIKNELLDKLGITNYSWKNDLSDLPKADEGSNFTSRDMLKLGMLAINNGQWKGEQLISEEYLVSATSKKTKASESWQPDNSFYGYFWYQTEIKVGDKVYHANLASGGGEQHIITLEELDLIIVVTGHDWEVDTIFSQISKTIVPAFVNYKLPVLEGSYLGQELPSLTPEPFALSIITTKH